MHKSSYFTLILIGMLSSVVKAEEGKLGQDINDQILRSSAALFSEIESNPKSYSALDLTIAPMKNQATVAQSLNNVSNKPAVQGIASMAAGGALIATILSNTNPYEQNPAAISSDGGGMLMALASFTVGSLRVDSGTFNSLNLANENETIKTQAKKGAILSDQRKIETFARKFAAKLAMAFNLSKEEESTLTYSMQVKIAQKIRHLRDLAVAGKTATADEISFNPLILASEAEYRGKRVLNPIQQKFLLKIIDANGKTDDKNLTEARPKVALKSIDEKVAYLAWVTKAMENSENPKVASVVKANKDLISQVEMRKKLHTSEATPTEKETAKVGAAE